MSDMLLVGLSQSEWESLMRFLAENKAEEAKDITIIIRKLINQIY